MVVIGAFGYDVAMQYLSRVCIRHGVGARLFNLVHVCVADECSLALSDAGNKMHGKKIRECGVGIQVGRRSVIVMRHRRDGL